MGVTTHWDEKKSESFQIFDQIAKTYDQLNKILSLGIDKYWRWKLKAALPNAEDLNLLDLATGTGEVAFTLAKDKRIKKIHATDLSKEMVKFAIEKGKGNEKIEFSIADAVNTPFADNSFDVATISFGLRNLSDKEQALINMARVLKPKGRLLVLEFSLPKFAIIRIPYLFYFRKVLPFIGNKLSGHPFAYTYLNETVESFPYGQEMAQIIKNAGFKKVTYTPLTFGVATLYIGDK